jgi:hypothetical protein
VFKERELGKDKGVKKWQQENYKIRLLKLLDIYNIVGLKNNMLPSMKVHYRVIGLDCLIILPQLNRLREIEPVKQISNLSFQNKLRQRRL